MTISPPDAQIQWYAITQTLKPAAYKVKARTQLEKSLPVLVKLLKQVCTRFEIIAELTEQCNIHYHGKCKFISEDHKYAYSDAARTIGHFLVKPIDNHIKWDEYMKKDLTKTLRIMNTTEGMKKLQQEHIRKEYVMDDILGQMAVERKWKKYAQEVTEGTEDLVQDIVKEHRKRALKAIQELNEIVVNTNTEE